MPPVSSNSQNTGNPSTPPQSIPLRNLTRPPDSADLGDGAGRHTRGRSLLDGGLRPSGSQSHGPRYERLGDSSPSPNERVSYRPQLSRLQIAPPSAEPHTPFSPVGDVGDLQIAMGFAGLHVPDISITEPPQELPTSNDPEDFGHNLAYYDGGGDEIQPYFASEADNVPLTDPKHMQPLSGAPYEVEGQRHDRSSFHTVSFNLPGQIHRRTRLEEDLESPGTGPSMSKGARHGDSLTPNRWSSVRSPSTAAAFSRAGSIVRAMSQRVVNLSGETEVIEESARREAIVRRASRRSRATSQEEDAESDLSSLDEESEPQIQRKADPLDAGPNYQSKVPGTPAEKTMRFLGGTHPEPSWDSDRSRPPNPLKGKSLGIFSTESRIRNMLCDILVYPLTEPAILLLIILQTVLLAVSASESVYAPGNELPSDWEGKPIDLALLILFVIFTIEIGSRIIVSGFIFNAPEYSNGNGTRTLRKVIVDNYRTVFAPQRQSSLRVSGAETSFSAPQLLRSFTGKQGEGINTVEQAQRLQLARRAFLRHSFNRLDLIAVVSFWISFVLSMTGIETTYHLYVFRMMSCLRILRLLAITHGTSVCSYHLTHNSKLIYETDHSKKSKESRAITRQCFLSDFFFLAAFCHHWSAELQIQF